MNLCKWLYLAHFQQHQQQSASSQIIDKDPKPENTFKDPVDSNEGRNRDQTWDENRSRATSSKEAVIGQEADSQSNDECSERGVKGVDEGVVEVVDSTCKSEEKQEDTARFGQQRLLSSFQNLKIQELCGFFCLMI